MGTPHICVSSGGRYHGTEGAHCSCYVLAARRRAVSFMAGNGIAFRDARTGYGGSVGDAALVPDWGTLLKAVIYALRDHFVLSEACRAPSHGFLMSSRPSMIPASTSFWARIGPKQERRGMVESVTKQYVRTSKKSPGRVEAH